MKVILTFLALLLLATSSISAQNPSNEGKHKVIIVINTASWCPACKKNGSRVEKEVISSFMGNTAYAIVVNDLSNEASIKSSEPAIVANGLADLLKKNKSTGYILLVDANTKQILSKVSVKEDSETLLQSIKVALSKAS
jgi:hypothetical protein